MPDKASSPSPRHQSARESTWTEAYKDPSRSWLSHFRPSLMSKKSKIILLTLRQLSPWVLRSAALVARNHLLSLSFSVDIYAKSLGERTSGGVLVIILRALQLPLNLRKFLQFSYTISLIINGFNLNYCRFFGGCYQGGFSTVLNSMSWPQMAA